MANKKKKRSYSASRAIIEEELQRWIVMLGLSNWKFNIGYDTKLNAQGQTEAWPRYLEATITFNPQQASELDEDEITDLVTHELTHVVLSPITEAKRRTIEATESCVTATARIFQRLSRTKESE